MSNDDLALAVEGARADNRGRRRGKCPRCVQRDGKEDRHGALCVWPSGFTKCFKCSLTAFIFDYADREHLVRDNDPEAPAIALDGFEPLYERVRSRTEPTSLCLEPAREYMRKRGAKKRVLFEAGVGATLEGWYANRIIFPLLESDGGWIGFVARTWLPNEQRKYRNSTGLARSNFLYNAQALNVISDEPAYVVEGIPDALALWPDAVAPLGALGAEQLEMLARACRPVVFVSDGDAWQKSEAHALELRLRGMRVGAVQLPATRDPDEMIREHIEEAARASLE